MTTTNTEIINLRNRYRTLRNGVAKFGGLADLQDRIALAQSREDFPVVGDHVDDYKTDAEVMNDFAVSQGTIIVAIAQDVFDILEEKAAKRQVTILEFVG